MPWGGKKKDKERDDKTQDKKEEKKEKRGIIPLTSQNVKPKMQLESIHGEHIPKSFVFINTPGISQLLLPIIKTYLISSVSGTLV